MYIIRKLIEFLLFYVKTTVQHYTIPYVEGNILKRELNLIYFEAIR